VFCSVLIVFDAPIANKGIMGRPKSSKNRPNFATPEPAARRSAAPESKEESKLEEK
jgi:hypothetical protein